MTDEAAYSGTGIDLFMAGVSSLETANCSRIGRKPKLRSYAAFSASAVSRISSPESSSLSVTVNGGAMRKIPPIPGN